MLKEALGQMKGKEKQAVAKKWGCSPRYIDYLQKGERVPSPKLMRKIAEHFDWNLADLILSIYDVKATPSDHKVTFKNKTLASVLIAKLKQIECIDPKELKRVDISLDNSIHFLLKDGERQKVSLFRTSPHNASRG